MSIPGNWRTRHQRYSLKAEVCEECHKVIFPPRDVCPTASEKRMEAEVRRFQEWCAVIMLPYWQELRLINIEGDGQPSGERKK